MVVPDSALQAVVDATASALEVGSRGLGVDVVGIWGAAIARVMASIVVYTFA